MIKNMKRLFALLLFCVLMLRSSAFAQNADDQYVRIYSLIQEGDALSDANHPKDALNKYLDAQTNLVHFQRSFPSWNALVVEFRLNYLTGQIAEVRSKLPVVVETNVAVVAPAAMAVAPQPSAEQAAQLNALQTQVGMLQAEKQELEAKLKEAFAAQPAAVDPRELAKAQDDVRALQKENDLLKASLAQAQEQAAKPAADPKVVAQLKAQLDESNRKLTDATDKASKQAAAKASETEAAQEKLAALQADNDKLKASLTEAQASATNSAADTTAVVQLKQQLADSNRKLSDASDKAAKLTTASEKESAAAQEKLAAMQAENDKLKASLGAVQSTASSAEEDAKALAQLKQQLADSNRKLAEASDKAAKLATANEQLASLQVENDLLKTNLKKAQAAAATSGNTEEVDLLRKQLADSNLKLATAMQHQPAPVPSTMNTNADNVLRAENDVLKKQLAAIQAPDTNASPADVGQQLVQTKAQLAALQSDTEILKLENMALANRAAAATNPPVNTAAIVAPAPVDTNTKIQQLSKERDDLQKKLDAAKKQLAAAKGQTPATAATAAVAAAATSESPATNAVEVQSIKSQLDVLQATAVPYTPEELALFKAPAAELATNSTAPAVDSAQLLSDARDAFAAGQYDKAHDDYLQVLQTDPRNEFVLANLAAIEVELNKQDDADKHIQLAVSLAPSDSYSLTVLGNLRLHQNRFDDALIALSRAAEISPQNPEIQNYLGVTLSHKGLRAQAETALRKAIQIDPKYGGAHNNLAVIYLSQNPPYVELARWHYQKALAAGFPHNPELEKQLNATPATTTQ